MGVYWTNENQCREKRTGFTRGRAPLDCCSPWYSNCVHHHHHHRSSTVTALPVVGHWIFTRILTAFIFCSHIIHYYEKQTIKICLCSRPLRKYFLVYYTSTAHHPLHIMVQSNHGHYNKHNTVSTTKSLSANVESTQIFFWPLYKTNFCWWSVADPNGIELIHIGQGRTEQVHIVKTSVIMY